MPASVAESPDIRFVIIHIAGQQWDPDLDIFQQPYILRNPDAGKEEHTHVNHYRQLLSQGKLEMGGPYPETSAKPGTAVGMMVPVAGVSRSELDDFASRDPAVTAGILDYEIRPWLVAMQLTGSDIAKD